MTTSAHDPHLANLHSDELIPDWAEDAPLTWLDEIGLHRELDAAVSRVRAALAEGGTSCTEERVRLAVAAWIEKTVRLKLELPHLLTTGGAEHFFSILNPTGDAGDETTRMTQPPPPPPDGHNASSAHNEQAF